jgi:hypothetical protein
MGRDSRRESIMLNLTEESAKNESVMLNQQPKWFRRPLCSIDTIECNGDESTMLDR